MSQSKPLNTKPFALLKAAFDTNYPLNTLVMFEHDGRPYVGYISGTAKDRYIVTISNEKSYELTGVRLHKLPGTIPEDVIKNNAQDAFIDKLASIEEFSSIRELWTKAIALHSSLWKEHDLCVLWFNSLSLEGYVQLRTALINDRVYFCRDKDGFTPRTEESIAEQIKIAKLKKEKEATYLVLAKHIESKEKEKVPPAEVLPILKLISECAARSPLLSPEELQDIEEAVCFIENRLGLDSAGTLDARAYQLALKAKLLKRDSNLALIKHRISTDFPHYVQDEATAIHLPHRKEDYDDFKSRLDLTYLDTFTIDDESTKDMDDALSLEETDSGYRLGIHIIDVAYAIQKDTVLDKAAYQRATSIYCPDITVNMFPEVLSQDQLSLKQNALRPCISCVVEIDKNFKPINADVILSFISVKRRLSYTQSDELLFKNDRTFSLLHQIAGVLEEQRIEKGAVRVIKREVAPIPSKNDVTLVEVDENAPSRHLVGEMMILANSIMANFLAGNDIPALYRTQEKPDPIDQSQYQAIPPGPAQDYFERSRLKRSLVGLRPGYHATLGLSAYSQMTSPIRRYVDLCLQRQLTSFLLNKPLPYSAEDLDEIQSKLDEPLMRATYAARESKRYWILRYLERYLKDDKAIAGIVVRADNKTTLVELDEVFLTFHARINKPRLGQRVMLKINHIDFRTDYVKLEEKKR